MWTSRGRILREVRVRTRIKADDVPDIFKEQEEECGLKTGKTDTGHR